jgi:WD40 repeat protein
MRDHDHYDVFISYARSDGKTFAQQKLRQRLASEASDLCLWQDLADMEGDSSWWERITQALDVVKILILVVTPAALRSREVKREWQYARSRGVRIYLAKGVPDSELDFDVMPRWMRKEHFYDLDTEWDKFLGHLRRPRKPARVPFMAPALPDGFIERPREFEQLKNLLLDPGHQNPIAITTDLRGAGGFGKTTLAAALCHDPDVITAFDDGILWVTLGERPNVLDGLIKLYAALRGERPGFRDVDEAAHELRSALGEKDCLLVIDDAWDLAHLRPFLNFGPGCARLITTRQVDVAEGARSKPVAVDRMTPEESVDLLAAKLDSPTVDKGPFRPLAQRLGEWPLLLELVGAQIRLHLAHRKSLETALDSVNRALDQKGVTTFDSKDPKERQQSMTRTIDVSLDLLAPDERQHYIDLAIFPEDTSIPLAALQALWKLDDTDTEHVAIRLATCSLLRFDGQAGSIRLHGVIRKYLGERLAGAASTRHARLVDSWHDVYRLPHGYAWRLLAYHLLAAGQSERLRELLLDFDWMRAKLEATDPNALLADYDALEKDRPEDQELRLVHGAIRLSAHVLARDKAWFADQVYGRLLSFDTAGVQALLARARSAHTGPWLRPLAPCQVSPGGALLLVLTGHQAGVNAVAVTPDGRLAVSGSWDRTLRIWDLESGAEQRRLEGHEGAVCAVALTPEGRLAISASHDHTLRIWDIETGEERRRLEGHEGAVYAVAVTPDGRLALSASWDRTLRLWDLKTGQERGRLRSDEGAVKAVALTPDGRLAVTGSDDRTLRVWVLETGQERRRLAGHEGAVKAVVLTPDGRVVVSGSDDHTLRIWDIETGEERRRLAGHAGAVNAVAVTRDGRFAVSASDDCTLRLWDLESGQELCRFKGHGDSIWGLAVSPNGRLAVSASDDRTLRLWDLESGRERRRLEGHEGPVHAVAVTPDGRLAVSASADWTLRLWDLKTGQERHRLEGHEGAVTAVAVTPDGRLALSASNDRTLRLWDLETGQERRRLEGHEGNVTAVAVAPDGRLAASASADCTLRLWDLESRKTIARYHGDAAHRTCCVAPDCRTIVASDSLGRMHFLRLEYGESTGIR